MIDVGILGFQGCIEPHENMLRRLGVTTKRVLSTKDLELTKRLIIPGGESTTMLKFLEMSSLTDAIRGFARYKPVWGVCAGAILLAKQVSNPAQRSLDIIDIHASRNYYGSQLNSFSGELKVSFLDYSPKVDFIRAPVLNPLSSEVEVLAYFSKTPVLFKQEKIIASAFHSELQEDPWLHNFFLNISN